MTIFSKIKGGIYHGIGFALVIGTIGATYAAYEALTNVSTGGTLTASFFNKVLENQRTFRSEIDNLNTAVLAVVPSGAVMAFKSATCPPEWKPADGVNATPDLRGEFIRGFDNGRGVDSGRTLLNAQGDSFKSHNHVITSRDVYNVGAFILNDNTGDAIVSSDNTASDMSVTRYNRYYTEVFGGTETRPRNVALLYCVKN